MENEDMSYEELLEEFKADGQKIKLKFLDLLSDLKKKQKQDKLLYAKLAVAALVILLILYNIKLIFDGLLMILGVFCLLALIAIPVMLAIWLPKHNARKKQEKQANREKELAEYRACTYFALTKKPLEQLEAEPDRYAEYLIYKELQKFEEQGAKFLFNLEIPRDGGGCSKIDILMISPKGVFVIQSRNIPSSIFGRENEREWIATRRHLGKETAVKFPNPVSDTKACANHLKEHLGPDVPVHSLIVFPDKSDLKDVSVFYGNYVINRNITTSIVTAISSKTHASLSEETIVKVSESIYGNAKYI